MIDLRRPTPQGRAYLELRELGYSDDKARRLWADRVQIIAILQHWGAKS